MTISQDALRSPAVGTGGNEPRPVRVPRRVAAPVMVGRDGELDVLTEALATPPAVAVIEGEAGIGKTRLLAELAARPEMSGRRWLTGGCRRIREPFPLGPVIEALRGLEDDLRSVPLSPVSGVLRPLLPELSRVLMPALDPLDDRAAQRHRTFRALGELLAALAPTVLVLEDLHWADEQTAEFLTYLLGDPPKGLSVVLTYRGEEVDAGVRAVTAKPPASLRCAHVALEPMDTEQTGTLAASILGTERVSGDFAEHLCGRASGVPFAIEELLALLRARRTLTRTPAGWARQAIDELDVPSGIRDPVLERVSCMSSDARAVVEAAAVLQEPAALSVLLSVSRVSESEAARAVEEALASGLLVERDGAIGFRHVLAAQAVYGALTGPHCQDLHARAATALRELGPVPLGQLAHHLRRADRLQEWAVAAERAADQAIALGHDAEAVRLLEDVLSHGPQLDPRRAGAIAIKLGRAAHGTLTSSAEVMAQLSRAMDADVPREIRGELAFWLSTALHDANRDPRGRQRLLLEAVDCLDHRPTLLARAMVGLGINPGPEASRGERMYWLNRVLAVRQEISDPIFRTFLTGKVAANLLWLGEPGWRALSHQVDDSAATAAPGLQMVNATLSIGLSAVCVGHYECAESMLTRAMSEAARCGAGMWERMARADFALLNCCRGRWSGLGEWVTVLVDEVAAAPLALVDVKLAAGILAMAHGDLDVARRYLCETADQVDVMGEYHLLSHAISALVRLDWASGNTADVAARANSLMKTVEGNGMWASIVRALPALSELLSAQGRVSEADELLRRCASELVGMDTPLASAALEHGHGLLHAARNTWPLAAESLLAAADLYAAAECPYEAAQARERAVIAMFEVEDTRAEPTLHAALETYRRLGATWDEARCTRDARAHGLRIARPHRGGRKGYGEALSPREDAVARLAAEGKTNKEIAAELFLTAATVNKHLGRAMRKLGVHSRAAVAGRLPDRLPTNPSPNGGGR